MKRWTDLTCLICGFRFSPRRFIRNAIDPVRFPAQIITGGGRARGFRVVGYVCWPDVAGLKAQPDVWRALNCEYLRLASAFDSFHTHLGFLSPGMREMIASLNAEIFQLRSNCRQLQDRLDRLLLTYPRRSESIGEFERILEEIGERDEEDRRSARDLIK